MKNYLHIGLVIVALLMLQKNANSQSTWFSGSSPLTLEADPPSTIVGVGTPIGSLGNSDFRMHIFNDHLEKTLKVSNVSPSENNYGIHLVVSKGSYQNHGIYIDIDNGQNFNTRNFGVFSRIYAPNAREIYGIFSTVDGCLEGNRWSGYFEGGDFEISRGIFILSGLQGGNKWQLSNQHWMGDNSHGLFIIPGDPNAPGGWDITNQFEFIDNGDLIVPKRLGVGTSCFASDAIVAIEGTLYAREIKVNINNWCDYVFSDSYKLKPLSEVNDYIMLNKHLPDVPSESEVVNNGLNLGEMNTILLKKVEELTLYLIELECKIKEMQVQMEYLSTK